MPRPISATTPAPFRIRRRVAENPVSVVLIRSLLKAAVTASAGKSTTALISFSVKIRFRPNGGITVSGLRLVSSVTIATRSSRLGYLLLMSVSSGPMVPGRSPPLITWQVRQLPLPRSKASFWPSAAADCARAGLAEGGADQQRQDEGWLCEESGDQGRFPDVSSDIQRISSGLQYRRSKAQRPLAGNAERQACDKPGLIFAQSRLSGNRPDVPVLLR